jgi:hypothetical protein
LQHEHKAKLGTNNDDKNATESNELSIMTHFLLCNVLLSRHDTIFLVEARIVLAIQHPSRNQLRNLKALRRCHALDAALVAAVIIVKRWHVEALMSSSYTK